jgi:predicted DCC family thiol-disulfide oxidoreductase YuxK
MILIKNGNLYDRSDAVLEIAKDLSGLWPVFYFFKIIPAFLRNAVYRAVAKNRYRLFGKKDECMIPTPELKMRFLE